MSEFQVSLLSIGAVVVVAVYLYGLWQQWRYRRSLGKPFQEPTAQPIADVVAQSQDDADTQHFIADPVPETSPQFDDKTDFIVSMTLKFPQNAEALDGYWQRRFDYGKTIQAIGCSAATGVWERVIPESRTSYSAFKLALQLVDRNGPISDTRLADFRELLGAIGQKLDADMMLPMVDSAIERARELDKFCADVDQMIGINIVPSSERVLFGSEVARAVQLIGMSLQADGTFHQFDADGATLFTLSASDGTPFQHHTLDQMQVDNMTVLLDIPRVKDPVKNFDEMTLLAMEVATTLRATLVDDQRVTLDNTAISRIRSQVEAVEKSMLAGGIAPGSDRALRLFS
ncbi:MAG: cell division protein ZipA C-terminal FtsZ-binding domain-containing protein [Sideroxydans sp.]|jgi:FtsZ-interacting cell division protein ZipA